MAGDIPNSASGGSSSFRKMVAAFLADESLPFARILSAERVERVFAKHDGLFGKQAIYSTAMMVWSFLGQVLRDGKEASCQAAVARVVNYCEHQQIAPPTANTGDYCRAAPSSPKRHCTNSVAKWPPRCRGPPQRIGCGGASTQN